MVFRILQMCIHGHYVFLIVQVGHNADKKKLSLH
jgi:hypothetical protein